MSKYLHKLFLFVRETYFSLLGRGLIKRSRLFFAGLCMLLFSTCVKEKDYPAAPVIKFKSFKNVGLDSAYLTISFTDGDGDIGLTQSDTSGIYSVRGKYYNNLYIRYYYKDTDGIFKIYETAPGDTLEYAYRIPKLLKDAQQKKALSGDIKVTLTGPITLDPSTLTIRYDVYIFDRALHKSNVINTGTIHL